MIPNIHVVPYADMMAFGRTKRNTRLARGGLVSAIDKRWLTPIIPLSTRNAIINLRNIHPQNIV